MKNYTMSCTAPDCDRRVETYVTKQLCSAHYLQQARGKPFTKPRERAIGICRFETCERAVSSRGLCGGHYQQELKGYELRELNRGKHAVTRRDAQGRKECQLCRAWKPESEYGANRSASDGLRGRCQDCYRATYDPGAVRARALKKKYNMTVAEYESLVAAQGDSCAICGTTDRRGKSWHIDHDHSCCPGDSSCGRCVRGLLCSICNQALGMARDDVAILASMIDYLNAHTTLMNPTRTRSAR